MSLFVINWRNVVINLLPSFLRSKSLVDFITALLEGLKIKSSEWLSFDLDVRKRAKFNSQIVVLRAALNDIFDVTSSPFILVETTLSTGQIVYFYNESEAITPTHFHNDIESKPVYFYNSSEVSTNTTAFVVKIPIGIYTAELERRVKSEVNTYKLSGLTFSIETY